jgi:hypothetical protein
MPPGDIQMELQLHDGVGNEKFKHTVPVVRPPIAAEFFPEGGDLIADLPNRVYFRLQVPLWVQPGVQCTLVDSKHNPVLDVPVGHSGAGGQLLLGQFTFTPRRELYKLRVIANGQEVDYLPLPSVKQNGLVLSTPASVLAPTDPVRVHLGTTHKNSDLLVLASCRGRIVDQKQLVTTEKFTEVLLEPAYGVSGVLRVTVFERPRYENDWRPVAERLVYRLPAKYLKLSAMPNKGTRRAYSLGEHVELLCEARNEANALTPAWLHVLVIDARAQQPVDYNQPGVGSYFLMTTELRQPEDLENADFLLGEGAGAAQALDLYLGTQGWRAFRDAPANRPTTLRAEKPAGTSVVPEIFVGGTRLESVGARFDRKYQQEREALWNDAERKREALELQRGNALGAVERAGDELNEYLQLPLVYLRPAVGVLVWLLIGGGVLLLGAALLVVVRKHRSPRFWLVSAFCTLLGAVVVYGATSRLRTEPGDPPPDPLAGLEPRNWSLGNRPPAPAKEYDRGGEAGKVFAQTYGMDSTKTTDLAKVVRDEQEAVAELSKQNLNRQLLQVAAETDQPGPGKKGASVPWQERLGAAKELEKMETNQFGSGGYGGGTPGMPGPFDKNTGGKGKKKGEPGKGGDSATKDKAAEAKSTVGTALLRDYAHLHTAGTKDYQDTVLWAPALLTQDGTATVGFELSGMEATYRIVIYGHTGDGRLGTFQGKLQAK